MWLRNSPTALKYCKSEKQDSNNRCGHVRYQLSTSTGQEIWGCAPMTSNTKPCQSTVTQLGVAVVYELTSLPSPPHGRALCPIMHFHSVCATCSEHTITDFILYSKTAVCCHRFSETVSTGVQSPPFRNRHCSTTEFVWIETGTPCSRDLGFQSINSRFRADVPAPVSQIARSKLLRIAFPPVTSSLAVDNQDHQIVTGIVQASVENGLGGFFFAIELVQNGGSKNHTHNMKDDSVLYLKTNMLVARWNSDRL